jgi:hypothetical protein
MREYCTESLLAGSVNGPQLVSCHRQRRHRAGVRVLARTLIHISRLCCSAATMGVTHFDTPQARGGTIADTAPSVFWDDLARDLADPRFLREYVAESIRIATIDRIVNELDTMRQTAGLSKAELARRSVPCRRLCVGSSRPAM